MRAFPFPDRITSREELKRDILYHKIPQEYLEGIADRAWDTGVAAARDILCEHGIGKSIEVIAEACGLTIERVKKDNISGSVRYFSEYYSGRNKIYLYIDSVSKWADSNGMTFNEAVELILSHEFYHFLECTKLGLTSKQYTVPNIQIGSFKLGKSGIRALSEIGAHGFSRTFYELHGKLDASKAPGRKEILENQAVNTMMLDGRQVMDDMFSKGLFKILNRKSERGDKK